MRTNAIRETPMAKVKVTLPNGQVREYPKGVSLAEVVRDAGQPEALVAQVDGALRDLATKVERYARVDPLTFDQPEGLELYWHSSDHLLAQAVKGLFT
jgi:threonyl-tRNA synthetase